MQAIHYGQKHEAFIYYFKKSHSKFVINDHTNLISDLSALISSIPGYTTEMPSLCNLSDHTLQ